MIESNLDKAGFLRDAAYSFYFYNFFKDYEDQFDGAVSVKVNFTETPYTMLGFSNADPIIISEDKSEVIINFSVSRFYDRSGKPNSLPSPESIFKSLKSLMERAVNKYQEG